MSNKKISALLSINIHKIVKILNEETLKRMK